MTGEELFRRLGLVDEGFVQDAQCRARFRRFRRLPRWAVAACLCLLLMGVLRWMPQRNPDPGMMMTGGAAAHIAAGVQKHQGQTTLVMEPTVVLRVREHTDDGFTAQVWLSGTELLSVGKELNVVLPDSNFPGTAAYVLVRVSEYQTDTQTIVADWIKPWNGGGL